MLVADDEPDIGALIKIILTSERYEVRVVADGLSALTSAAQFRPDLVLLDVMMPGMSGLEVCQALRAEPTTSNVPIIMLTAKGTPADAIAGLRAGADDYILKPFEIEELLARLATTIRRSSDLRSASPLTGLPGNFDILRRLGYLVAPPVQDFALLQVDLDNFKAFNDHYGFPRGDEVIRTTGSVLQDCARRDPLHLLGHIGGDDFAVIVSADAAETTAQAITNAFDREVPPLYDPHDRSRGWLEVPDRAGLLHRYPLLTISVGVASTAQGRFSSVQQVSASAAEVRALAKRDVGSSWRLDRRLRGDSSQVPK